MKNNKKCNFCSELIISRFSKKYCSRKCYVNFCHEKYGHKSFKKCLGCEKMIQDRRIGRKFCTIRCKRNYYIGRWEEGLFNSTTERGSISNIIRNYLLKKNNKCEQCGWLGFNSITGNTTLQIDHTDGNRNNGFKGNLKVLCPNCHSLTHTWGALNIKKKRK